MSRLDAWCKTYSDFSVYLAYVFVKGEGLPDEVRQSSGLLLKNNLKAMQCEGQNEYVEIKALMVEGIQLQNRVLRHTAGTCTAALIAHSGFQGWPELVDILLETLKSSNSIMIEGGLNTVEKIWEDSPRAYLEVNAHGQAVGDILVPHVLQLLSSANSDIKIVSIKILNYALCNESDTMQTALDSYKALLFALAHDPNSQLRKAVCTGLIHLTELAPDNLMNDIPALVEYMIASTEDPNEELALEASEFWSVIAESGFDVEILRPFIPRIIPLLLKNMRYDEYDDEVAEAEADEETIISGHKNGLGQNSDLQLSMHSSSVHGAASGEDDDNDDFEEGTWNLRRSAAAGLDMLSNHLGDEILPILLPSVQQCLQDQNWRAREAAILALGAVSAGCHSGLQEHIGSIVGAVTPGMVDPRPMVRVISSWTLTRYSRQLYCRKSEGDPTLLMTVVSTILDRLVKERNKKVQVSLCGSVATLVEEDPVEAREFISDLVRALSFGLTHYRRRGLRAVYDAISAIAETSPETAHNQEFANLLFPGLFNKLQTFPDGDLEILPLLECIRVISSASGSLILPYAEQAFKRCVSLTDKAFIAADSGSLQGHVACRIVEESLDALGGIIEGVGNMIAPSVQQSNLGDILLKCANHDEPGIIQSAFGILGDLADQCIGEVLPILSPMLNAIFEYTKVDNLTIENIDAFNNAIWSLGVITRHCSPEDVRQFEILGLERLHPLLSAPVGAIPRSLRENSAVCLGRLGQSNPHSIAVHAHAYLGGWCSALRGMKDTDEKVDAYKGLCAIIKFNPDEGASHFRSICECFASWIDLTDGQLQADMNQILQGYKSRFISSQKWNDMVSRISPTVIQKLNLA